LKYTDSGWVKVHLKAEDLPHSHDDDGGKRKSKITLSVSDSGRGISREFLKAKLFTPFSQEDILTHGTGLGLSIVREIVQLLGGDIKVQSQVNVGTEVTITLVLDRPDEVAEVPDGHAGQLELALISQLRKHTIGKTICLTGVDSQATPADGRTHPYVLTSLRESLARYAEAWFGMHVVTGTVVATQGADIILANESADLVRYLEDQPDTAVGLRTPLIVLCSNVSQYRGYVRQVTNFHVLQFVSKP
jgi:Signal transduction histidine kinase